MEAVRVEHDLIGEIHVPKSALWGVHTARVVENFPITGVAIGHYRNLIKAMGLVKAAAARDFMQQKDFAGHILKRSSGYSAVCPTYPEGYYPDATLLESFENSKGELSAWQRDLGLISKQSCC